MPRDTVQIVLWRFGCAGAGFRWRNELVDKAEGDAFGDCSALGAAYEIRLISDDNEAVVFHVLIRERSMGAELGPPPGQGVECRGPIDVEHENGGVRTTKEGSGE